MAAKRVWYQSAGLQAGLTVTAKLYNEKNELIQDNIVFAEMLEHPIYYTNIEFLRSKCMMVIYENGEMVLMNVFDYTAIPGIVSYRIG